MLRVGMQPRRSSVTGSNSMGSTFCISPSISTEQQFFIKMIKSNQLEITTRDAGASGLHSNAEHWNEELFVLSNKNLSHRHVVKLNCLKPDNITHFASQFLKSMALMSVHGNEKNLFSFALYRFKIFLKNKANDSDSNT